MNDRRTEVTKTLVRQGLRGGSAATETTLGMIGASSQATALSAMGWANALLDREEEVETGHSPTAGEESQPMRISVKTGDQSPRQVDHGNGEPSPERQRRPVPLKLAWSSSRQRPVRYVAGPCLRLINGGKR